MKKIAAAAACIVLLSACCDCSPEAQARRNWHRAAPAPNPEVVSPKSHKTCTEDFGFKKGTPQYDKCINSLSQIESK